MKKIIVILGTAFFLTLAFMVYFVKNYQSDIWKLERTIAKINAMPTKETDEYTTKLLRLLNHAYSEEWIAYYQYWTDSKSLKGKTEKIVIYELEEHAADELRHAEMLASKIIELDGKPALKPHEWYPLINPEEKYLKAIKENKIPANPTTQKILQFHIKAEAQAIKDYTEISDFTKEKDKKTYEISQSILKDEIEHKEDLEKTLAEVTALKK